MMKRNHSRNHPRNHPLRHVLPFGAGVLIGTSVVTPVFAATLDMDQLHPLMLLGSLIVLLVGLTLKAMTARRTKSPEERVSDANFRDLRWRGDVPVMDVALPRTELRELAHG